MIYNTTDNTVLPLHVQDAIQHLHKKYLLPLYEKPAVGDHTFMRYSNTCIENAHHAQREVDNNHKTIKRELEKTHNLILNPTKNKTVKLMQERNNEQPFNIVGNYHAVYNPVLTDKSTNNEYHIGYETTTKPHHVFVAKSDDDLNEYLKEHYNFSKINDKNADQNYWEVGRGLVKRRHSSRGSIKVFHHGRIIKL